MSRWEALVAHRSWCGKMGLFTFALAIVLCLAQPWLPTKVPVAVVFGLLGSQMLMAHQLLTQLAAAQARIDMIRIARRETPE